MNKGFCVIHHPSLLPTHHPHKTSPPHQNVYKIRTICANISIEISIQFSFPYFHQKKTEDEKERKSVMNSHFYSRGPETTSKELISPRISLTVKNDFSRQ